MPRNAHAEDFENETTIDNPPEPEIEDDEVDDAASSPLSTDFLVADLRDTMLTRFRTAQKPWPQMTEDEQRGISNSFDMAARELVRECMSVITNYEVPRTVVVLGEVKIKGEKGIEAKITCANIEHNRTVLGENVGQFVSLLMADSSVFDAHRDPQIDPDAPELPIGGGEEDAGEPIAAE